MRREEKEQRGWPIRYQPVWLASHKAQSIFKTTNENPKKKRVRRRKSRGSQSGKLAHNQKPKAHKAAGNKAKKQERRDRKRNLLRNQGRANRATRSKINKIKRKEKEKEREREKESRMPS